MKDKQATVGIRASDEVIYHWKAQAFSRSLTLSALVRTAMSEYLTNHPLTDIETKIYQYKLNKIKEEAETCK